MESVAQEKKLLSWKKCCPMASVMSKTTRTERISARVEPALKKRLDAIRHKIERSGAKADEAELIRKCVVALCDYYDQWGRLPNEIAIRPSDAEIAYSVQTSNAYRDFVPEKKQKKAASG